MFDITKVSVISRTITLIFSKRVWSHQSMLDQANPSRCWGQCPPDGHHCLHRHYIHRHHHYEHHHLDRIRIIVIITSLWSTNMIVCVIVTVIISICVFVAINDIVTTIIIVVSVVLPSKHQHGNIALQKTQQWHLSSDWTLRCWSFSARPSGNVDCHIGHQDDGDVDPDDHDDDGIAPDWQKDYSSLQVGHLH